MEYKIGDEVIWDKTPYIFDGYFVNDTERVWLRNIYTGASSVVLKSEIIPATPRESHKELKKRIKELEQRLADAQEAVRIVEALEKMQSDFILSRTPINNYWYVTGIRTLVNQGSHPTIAQALQAAGLMESEKK